MSTQVQCPNCGGSYVDTKIELLDLKSKTKFEFGCGFWFFMFMGGMMVALGINVLMNPNEYEGMEKIGLSCFAMPFGILILIAGITAVLRYLKGQMIEQYHHTCWYCSYRWSRRADEPFPSITVRPDLILAGKQRLQDEYNNAVAHQAAEDALKRAGWR